MYLDKAEIKSGIGRWLKVDFGKTIEMAEKHEVYQSLVRTVMEKVTENWCDTDEIYSNGKQAYYLSAEFLMGRALGNNLINLGILDDVREVLAELDIDFNVIEDAEEDAGLGNGGLGRLAACFLDSMVTLNLPGHGYGIRYKNGIFNQKFENGFQVEYPESWLKYGDPWSIKKASEEVIVEFGDQTVRAIPHDTPIIGYGTKNVNTLRLWEAAPVKDLDLTAFNAQEYEEATREKARAEDISRVLYPNDSTNEGKKLRLKQQYFFVSASLQDILRKFKLTHGNDFEKLPEFAAIQLNDTHPVIAIPELMRLLYDVEGLEWNDAWDIVQKTCAYTNHTILAEALEKWWIRLYEEVVPRIYEITQRINIELIQLLEKKFPGQRGRQKRMSIIQGDLIHMAWMAIYGTHATNGVAALHTEILKEQELKEWYELFPERFQNKTNGVTQRRWMLLSNQQLSSLITELIGDKWITDLTELKKLEKYAEDEEILKRFLDIKHEKKVEFAKYMKNEQGVEIDPDSIFDIQIKRLHEYKRQLLNIFHVIDLYNRIKADPKLKMNPVTYIFGAKAAPGYLRAKGIIKLIHDVAEVVNNDPVVDGRIKVVFVENYRVSVAHKMFPAADISEQISTAGKEASGTGNMKFMLNGALTLGTLDGANVEIVEEAGEENNFIFGLKVEDILKMKKEGYDPHKPYNEVEGLKAVVDVLMDGTFSDEGTGYFEELYTSLMEGASWHDADQYFVLEDFDAYREIQKKANEAYSDKMKWAKMAWINIANGGKFSSDRTIAQYASEIWDIEAKKL
ncbi:alpha-1,4 glucan phosphorylase [Propionigenium maris DSM 9537]|uniref:Alpha-1,4 glucan phosphorylase n=1 Tax=Propionigenium maris DSM 9537 TaxID=1123000 RepID=A0A9W6LM94_9FUSO|nr:glycogen/starch/alpha-glucan phosphorylase [Propionigenium maris]GLI56101.1 alpha-1,4 glucan phosphorylase [Propionigenium maris DSM 9537]